MMWRNRKSKLEPVRREKQKKDMTENVTICPKCYAKSGDNWGQCRGSCPMPMSPHYDPEWKTLDIDLPVIKAAYGFTVADDGEIYGLVAGDMGYEPTGIKIPVEDLKAWAKYNYKEEESD